VPLVPAVAVVIAVFGVAALGGVAGMLAVLLDGVGCASGPEVAKPEEVARLEVAALFVPVPAMVGVSPPAILTAPVAGVGVTAGTVAVPAPAAAGTQGIVVGTPAGVASGPAVAAPVLGVAGGAVGVGVAGGVWVAAGGVCGDAVFWAAIAGIDSTTSRAAPPAVAINLRFIRTSFRECGWTPALVPHSRN
jgi:hypothetical protein